MILEHSYIDMYKSSLHCHLNEAVYVSFDWISKNVFFLIYIKPHLIFNLILSALWWSDLFIYLFI